MQAVRYPRPAITLRRSMVGSQRYIREATNRPPPPLQGGGGTHSPSPSVGLDGEGHHQAHSSTEDSSDTTFLSEQRNAAELQRAREHLAEGPCPLTKSQDLPRKDVTDSRSRMVSRSGKPTRIWPMSRSAGCILSPGGPDTIRVPLTPRFFLTELEFEARIMCQQECMMSKHT